MKKWLVAVISVVALIAGIGIGFALPHGTSEESPSNVQAAKPGVSPAPTPSAIKTDSQGQAIPNIGDKALPVGGTRHGTAIDTTVIEVKDDYRDGNYRAPDGSARWVGVNAKTCVTGKVDQPYEISWFNFEAGNADGESFPASSGSWDDFPVPQYPTGTDLQEGCRKGWLLISVPKNSKVDVIRLGSSAEWKF